MDRLDKEYAKLLCQREPYSRITPQMLEEGFRVFDRSGVVDDPSGADMLLVADIYLAMSLCLKNQEDL
jgi:hypothetical protein